MEFTEIKVFFVCMYIVGIICLAFGKLCWDQVLVLRILVYNMYLAVLNDNLFI